MVKYWLYTLIIFLEFTMQTVRRILNVPEDVDRWVEEKAKTEVRKPTNFYIKLAVEAKKAEEAKEAAND